jgi:hypothetical protein
MSPLGAASVDFESVSFNCDIQMHKTNSVEVVLSHLDKAAPGDWVIFDVDEVLISLKDRVLRPKALDFSVPLYTSLFFPLTDPEKVHLFGEWVSQVEVELISDELRDVIPKLKERGCMIMGLTSMVPGPGVCGKIPFMEDFRFHQLHNRGIDFRGSFNMDRLEIDLPEKEGRKPLFKDAILYARPYKKGEVLKSFLQQHGSTPPKIWFIDNDKKNVDDLFYFCRKSNIPYVGIEYLDEKFDSDVVDVSLGKFQFDYFKETKIWLNDAQAKLVLDQVKE